jgi:proton-dependent oligopeptide transporter, POT family
MTTTSDRFPPQVKYIVGNEGCERFSYYGMRGILTAYMSSALYLGLADNVAEARYHFFVAACYLTPLLGAFISDRFLGKYKTIMYLSIVYCIGHLVLAVTEKTEWGLYTGLALVALGAGGIKPCVSAHVGDQFTHKNKHLVKKIFDVFYWMINFGSFFSTLLTPWLLDEVGAWAAFGLPGVLMAIATFVFWLGRKQYVHVPPTGPNPHGFWMVMIDRVIRPSKKHPPEAVEAANAALRIFGVFAAISAFWALFDQHGSSWVNQAKTMDLVVFGATLKASQLSSLNPAMVMLMIPLFGFVVYPGFEKLTGIKLTPLRKMSAGMFFTASSFVAAALIQAQLDGGNKLNVMWQVIPYFLLTTGEILISITGLEFAYSQAPRSMKSTIMSLFFLTVFVGNVITGVVAQLNTFKGADFFYFFAGLMAVVGVIFVFIAARYKVVEYFEDGSAPTGAELEKKTA